MKCQQSLENIEINIKIKIKVKIMFYANLTISYEPIPLLFIKNSSHKQKRISKSYINPKTGFIKTNNE
jgi:hypothetical protein